jgi:hypothetical protein
MASPWCPQLSRPRFASWLSHSEELNFNCPAPLVCLPQACYCVDVIPEGEWLCWPCAQYEEQQRRDGKPQAEIRPPRCATAQLPDLAVVESA